MATDLHGLILTGGLSQRMGRDKASLVYGEDPQWLALGKLLEHFCSQVFWSCTSQQREEWEIGSRGLLDGIPGHGPASGLHAAFTFLSDTPWLVVACDYPFLKQEDIERLISARGPHAEAVLFANEEGAIEPLIAIWEPAAQKKFLEAFSEGDDSPRRALQRCRYQSVAPCSNQALTNANQMDFSQPST